MIHFTKHAREKFVILEKHEFRISKEKVVETITNPDKIDYSRSPLFIAQKDINSSHVLRVVYKVENNIKIIITFYPGRRKQYK